MFHAIVSTGATETLARGERIIVPICFKAAFGAFLYRIACNLTNIGPFESSLLFTPFINGLNCFQLVRFKLTISVSEVTWC